MNVVVWLWCIALISGVGLHAQGIIPSQVGIGYARGAWLEHTKKLSHLLYKRPHYGELSIGYQVSGKKSWHQVHNYPVYGFLLNYQDFGNVRIGESYAIAPYISFRMGATGRRVQGNIRLSYGLAYLNKRFDLETNHKHTAIGSNLNVFVSARFACNIQLWKGLHLVPYLLFQHVSNGRLKVPNLGINTVYPHVSLEYVFKDASQEKPRSEKFEFKKERYMQLWLGYGSNQEYPPGGKNYSNFTFSVQQGWRASPKSAFGIGAEAFYEAGLNVRTQPNAFEPKMYFKNGFSVGICGTYSFIVGNLRLPIGYGYYVYSGVNQFPNGRHYHRVGVQYLVKDAWMFSFTLKSHFAVAYHFDIGVGYIFPWNQRK